MRHNMGSPENNAKILEEEFLKCYDAYAEAVYRHCFFRVFSKPLAEEISQEAFMRTWECLDGGQKIDNIRAFVYRVATNLIIDRSRKKKEEALETLLEKNPNLEPSKDYSEDMESSLLTREVLRVIADLPEKYRQVLILRYVDELEPREIGAVLGLSANNASVRVNRALKFLRKVLKSKESWSGSLEAE